MNISGPYSVFDPAAGKFIYWRSEFNQLHIFRYPGGKKWFSVHALLLLGTVLLERKNVAFPSAKLLIEPFAGGAVVGLTLLNSDLADRLLLVEKDARVAAFWKTALSDPHFADRVERFRCTRKNVENVCANPDRDPAFWTLVKNRCAVGGNLTGGLMKDVSCRWNGPRHADGLRTIRNLSPRIEFIEGDGIGVLRKHADDPTAVAFVDPPYVIAGKGLYRQGVIDHSALFDVLASWGGFWMMTYDDSQTIRKLVKKHGFTHRRIGMRTNKGKRKQEIFVRGGTPCSPNELPRWTQTRKQSSTPRSL